MRATTVVAFLAVVALETFTELFPENWWFLGLYLACLFAIAGAVMIASWLMLSQLNEDMRGLKEVLRVQFAWWWIGINRMVDRVHLRSIDSDLTAIREISATIAMWARLRAAPDALLSGEAKLIGLNVAVDDLARAADRPAAKAATASLGHHVAGLRSGIEKALNNWVIAQANYYRNSSVKQRQSVLFAEQLTSMAFGVTLLMLLALLGLQLSSNALICQMASLQNTLHLPAAVWNEAGILLWLFDLLLVANVAIYHQTHKWQLLPPDRADGFCVPCWFAFLALSAAVLLMASAPWPFSARGSIAAALTFMGLTGAWFFAQPENTKLWKVPDLSLAQQIIFAVATAAALIGLDVLLAPGLAVLRAWLEPHAEIAHGADAAQHALVMVSATLALAATTLLKYYVEKRNHKAQFAEYSNQNRAFLRCCDTIKARLRDCQRRTDDLRDLADTYSAGAPTKAMHDCAKAIRTTMLDLRRLSIELGELALDENETWLQAHRERPIEATTGG